VLVEASHKLAEAVYAKAAARQAAAGKASGDGAPSEEEVVEEAEYEVVDEGKSS